MKNNRRKFPLKVLVGVLATLVLCVIGLSAQAQMASTGEAPESNFANSDSQKAKAISLDTDACEDEISVMLTADGETKTYTTTAVTVSDLLTEAGITLGEFDVVTPDSEEKLSDGIEVVVQRVEYKEETEIQIVDYGFVTEETSSLASGTTKIKQYGIEGERTVVTNNKYVDGVLTESVVISDEVTAEPVDQIKLVGIGKSNTLDYSSSSSSNAAGTFVDANGNTVSYVKKLTGTSTAYCADEGAITATGTPVFVGGVAVNPNVIPYGSKLYIVTSDGKKVYGYATAVDTGGALMNGSVLVDVFYYSYSECINWGRRTVTVYVLG